MSNINPIKNLAEYLKRIDSIFENQEEGAEFLYRGQADNYWPVKSSACRFFSNSYPILPLSKKMMEEYIEKQKKTIKNFTNEENSHYSLRHFGGHTPYIDFSRNCLVALYFACEELRGQEDGVVYILNIRHLERLGVELDDNGKGKKEAEARIISQNACLVFPLGIEIDKDSDKIEKIIIDKKAKGEILKQLAHLQISRTTIYPDLLEYIRQQGQYTDIFKKEILFEIMKPNIEHKQYPAVITSLLNLQNYKRITNNERKIIYCKLIKYYKKSTQPDKALELLDEKALKEDRIIDNDQKTAVIYKYDNEMFLTILSYERGCCYIQKKMYRSAINEFDKVINEYNKNIQFWRDNYVLEKAKEINSKSHKQITYLKIKLDPQSIGETINESDTEISVEERMKRAALYFECGKFPKAIEVLGNLGTDSSLNLKGRCLVGLYKEKQGDYLIAAREAFEKAIEITPIDDSKAHRYELATTYHGWKGTHSKYNNLDEAIRIYQKLSREPISDEEAKHRVAKCTYEKAQKEENDLDFDILATAVDEYIKAIEEKKTEDNATNFVDMGDIFFDIYKFEKKYPEREQETNNIKKEINKKFSGKLIKFRESGQAEVRKLMQTIRDTELTGADSLLLMHTYLLQIAIAIYPEDEYAFNKLGELYDILFENMHNMEYADKALAAYNRSRYFYIKKGMYFKKHETEDGIDLTELDKKITELITKRLKDEE